MNAKGKRQNEKERPSKSPVLAGGTTPSFHFSFFVLRLCLSFPTGMDAGLTDNA